MSLAPCKENSQPEQITLEKIFRDCLPALGIREIFLPRDWKRTLAGPCVIRCSELRISHRREDAIVILSPGAWEKLAALAAPRLSELIARFDLRRTALLVFAECRTLPAAVQSVLRRHRLPAAMSLLPENLLQSRIKAILQEKIKQTVTVHGVALEHQGRGILIRGVSGIGKTTAAMAVMPDGFRWIADDRVVVRKDRSGKLFLSGHRAIRKYVHTGQTGILAVERLWTASQIGKKAELAFIIEVIRSEADGNSCSCVETQMLATAVPLLRMHISQTGYFDKNLLRKAIQKWAEVDH